MQNKFKIKFNNYYIGEGVHREGHQKVPNTYQKQIQFTTAMSFRFVHNAVTQLIPSARTGFENTH